MRLISLLITLLIVLSSSGCMSTTKVINPVEDVKLQPCPKVQSCLQYNASFTQAYQTAQDSRTDTVEMPKQTFYDGIMCLAEKIQDLEACVLQRENDIKTLQNPDRR